MLETRCSVQGSTLATELRDYAEREDIERAFQLLALGARPPCWQAAGRPTRETPSEQDWWVKAPSC